MTAGWWAAGTGGVRGSQSPPRSDSPSSTSSSRLQFSVCSWLWRSRGPFQRSIAHAVLPPPAIWPRGWRSRAHKPSVVPRRWRSAFKKRKAASLSAPFRTGTATAYGPGTSNSRSIEQLKELCCCRICFQASISDSRLTSRATAPCSLVERASSRSRPMGQPRPDPCTCAAVTGLSGSCASSASPDGLEYSATSRQPESG